MSYAGFWKRVIAALIDGLILGAVASAAVVVATGRWRVDQSGHLGEGASTLLSWIYFAAFESSETQATVGKMALGIKVTDLNGGRISFARASGRHFGKLISGFICGIGFLMTAFTEKKQALHDILAGCLVVNR